MIPPPEQRIAVVSDEVSADFAAALAVCLPLGIRAVELRGLRGGRVPSCDPAAVDEVLRLVDEHRLTLTGISPGFFKGDCADEAQARRELDGGLDRCFALLDRLRVRRLTVFSFRRTAPAAPIPQAALALLSLARNRCRSAGVELLIENSALCWADTGDNLAAVARTVGAGVTWDPANCEAAGGRAYPDGYAAVRDCVAHVHLKNWSPGRGCVNLDAGQADLRGQVAALTADNYAGYYCIEPHQWDRGAEAVRENHAQLLALLKETTR